MVIRSSRVRIPPSPLQRSSADTPDTSTPSGSRHPGRVIALRGRSADSRVRRGDTRPATDADPSPPRASRHAPTRASETARRRSRRREPTTETRARARAPRRATCFRFRRRAAGRRVPRPRAAPGRSGGSGRRRRGFSVAGARRSGPSARTPPSPRASTGPFHCVASHSRLRRTSHGDPRHAASERRRTRQRPFMRRWLRTTTEPSKRRSRCFPTASTDSSLRPSIRDATPVTWPRGFGLSASMRSPTRTCSRRAARWSESPSGTHAACQSERVSRRDEGERRPTPRRTPSRCAPHGRPTGSDRPGADGRGDAPVRCRSRRHAGAPGAPASRHPRR